MTDDEIDHLSTMLFDFLDEDGESFFITNKSATELAGRLFAYLRALPEHKRSSFIQHLAEMAGHARNEALSRARDQQSFASAMGKTPVPLVTEAIAVSVATGCINFPAIP